MQNKKIFFRAVKNDRQEQYSHRNCILIHGTTETQDENTDDISLRTINEHLKVELTEKELLEFQLPKV